MKKLVFLLLIAMIVLAACQQESPKVETEPEKSTENAERIALNKENPAGNYGEAMNDLSVMPISQVWENAAEYEGKQVSVTGKVADVCPKRGCWIDVKDDSGNEIRVKVKDGDIVFPLSAKGHNATVQGPLEKIELSEKQAIGWMAHLAEEKGEPFDSSSVTGPMTIWRIHGKGAVIQ